MKSFRVACYNESLAVDVKVAKLKADKFLRSVTFRKAEILTSRFGKCNFSFLKNSQVEPVVFIP